MSLCLMFHSVGLRRHPWVSPQIAEDLEPLRDKLLAIRDQGFRVVRFGDPAQLARNGTERTLSITFDDGYLDNWVHVLPVLEELEMPATIFVSTDFIDRREDCRVQRGVAGIRDREHDASSCCAGFLSWGELRRIEAGGLVDIQSHAATHTRWPIEPAIREFWIPGAATAFAGPVHELWNRFPAAKPHYLTQAAARETQIPYGTPVYAYERALVARRFLADDAELTHHLTQAVQDQGPTFFSDLNEARQRLKKLATDWLARHGGSVPGRHESDAEREARVRDELASSRRILEEILHKEITTICWPEGGVDETALSIAREVGYRHFTLPSAWNDAQARGQYAALVPRISSGPRESHAGRDLGHLNRREFGWYLRRAEGSTRHLWLYRGAKLARLMRAYVVPFG